jgi:DNA-binding GntR family transcriptional regulator
VTSTKTRGAVVPTAQQAVLRELRRAILGGILAPGTQLIQEALADQLGFSVVPVREALRILESEGHVTYIARKGYFVTEINQADLLEICAIRSELEALAVRSGVPNMAAENFARMQDALDTMDSADAEGDVATLCDADRTFHFEIFRSAGMPRLTRLVTMLWDQSDAYRTAFLRDPAARKKGHVEHRRMLKLARAGKVDELIGLLDDHRLSPTSVFVEPTR